MTYDKTYDSEAGRLKVTLKSTLGNRVPEKEKVTRKVHLLRHIIAFNANWEMKKI